MTLEEAQVSDKVCPFCKEEDFDLIGLYLHFKSSNCSLFPHIEDLFVEEQRLREERMKK